MEQYKTIVLSARYPHIRYESIKELAKADNILQKSLVSFNSKLEEVDICGFKIFDYENSELGQIVESPNWLNLKVQKVNLLRTQLKNCLSLSNDKYEVNSELALEVTDKIINQENVSSKMGILNYLYNEYYKEKNNVESKTIKSQNYALATFYVYFNEYLNLNIDFKDWSKDYLNFKPIQFVQIHEMEQIRIEILKDFNVKNIDYAIECMNYLRQVGYSDLSTKVKSDNSSFEELELHVSKFNELYDLSIYKEKYYGIEKEQSCNTDTKFKEYIVFLENNYETIQKASVYELLNNRGVLNDYSEEQIENLLDLIYSEFKSSDYLSIVDYSFIDDGLPEILSSFEQEDKIESMDAKYSNKKTENINEIEI